MYRYILSYKYVALGDKSLSLCSEIQWALGIMTSLPLLETKVSDSGVVLILKQNCVSLCPIWSINNYC